MPSSGAPVHVYQMKFAAQTKRSSPLKLSLGKSGYLLHIWGDKLPNLGPLWYVSQGLQEYLLSVV